MNQKGFSQVILLGIITVIILAGAGGFLVLREKKLLSSEKTVQQEVSPQKTEGEIQLPETQTTEDVTSSIKPIPSPAQSIQPAKFNMQPALQPTAPTQSPVQSIQPPKQSVSPAAKDTGGYSFEIKGYVHDVTDAPAMTNGTPVAGIVLSASGPKLFTTQTRADGSYTLSFTAAPLGTYDVCFAIPPGYRTNPPSGCTSVIVRLSEEYVKTLELINEGHMALHWTAINFHILRQ